LKRSDKECEKCELCCQYIEVPVYAPISLQGKLDTMRWLSYHSNILVVGKLEDYKNKPYIMIRINEKCINLKEENGIYNCSIYEKRPYTCRAGQCLKP
jgi:Fe-S-cluster containining protein